VSGVIAVSLITINMIGVKTCLTNYHLYIAVKTQYICTLSGNIKFKCTHIKTGKKSSAEARCLFFLFLKLVNINFIFAVNVRILSIHIT
jgi:hypothetical protein